MQQSFFLKKNHFTTCKHKKENSPCSWHVKYIQFFHVNLYFQWLLLHCGDFCFAVSHVLISDRSNIGYFFFKKEITDDYSICDAMF